MKPIHNRSIGAILLVALATLVTGSFGGFRAAVGAQGGGRQVPAATPTGDSARGKAVYDGSCVECHGDLGRGDGSAAPYLRPRPRDLTAGKYKIRSTETGSLPTDADLERSVRQGLPGSAMPAWDTILSDGEIHDVIQYVKGFSPRFKTDAPIPVKPGAPVPSSPASVARGQKVFEKLECARCHGTDGRGVGADASELKDDWNQPLNATNLTEPWTFHGGGTPLDVYLRLRTGMTGTPMPSYADAASNAEMWDLANYVVSLARKPAWTMTAEELTGFYARLAADAKADPVKRGAYLVDTIGCAMCHSPVDEQKRMLPGLRLAGGLRIRIEPFGEYPTGNLTSDKETGLGDWTDDEIKQVLTKGTLRDGTRLLPYPMDWPSYSTMTPDDISAIVAYLRTVPPVYNRVPAPSRTFLPLYLWGKFKVLILGEDPPMFFFAGNAGTRGGR